jgi:multisubunit Na+/H+ antiporter MnhF subunit
MMLETLPWKSDAPFFFFLMRGGTGPSSRSRSACLRALLGIASPAIDEIRWWYGARACVDVDLVVLFLRFALAIALARLTRMKNNT